MAQQEVEPDKTISHPGPAHCLFPVTLYLLLYVYSAFISLISQITFFFFALGHLTPLKGLCLATPIASFKVLGKKSNAYFVYEALSPDVH